MRVAIKSQMNDPLLETMNFLNEVVMSYPDAVSFAPGRPVESFFGVERSLTEVSLFVKHYQKVHGGSEEEVYNFLGQYGRTNGIIGDLVARHLAVDENIHVPADAVAITNGCQEGMAMLLMALFQPGRDVLLVSDPSYIGITGTARVLGIDIEPVSMIDGDLHCNDLQAAVERVRASGKNPKAFYHIPDFNNPLGTSTSLEERKRILAYAEADNLLIFEDNPYGMFAYDGQPLPTMKSLDDKAQVVYMGTFAKTLFPGLRVGYLVADQMIETDSGEEVLLSQALSKVKSFVSVNTSPILQAIAGGILLENDGELRGLIQPKLAFYKKNRDHMISCLETFTQEAGLEGVSWATPAGGFFMTVYLPFEFDEASVKACAEEFGVIVCPMQLFSLKPGYERQIRLSFSYVNPTEIERGIKGLVGYLKAQS